MSKQSIAGLIVVVNRTNLLMKKIYSRHYGEIESFRKFANQLQINAAELTAETIWEQAEQILGTRRCVIIVDPQSVHVWSELAGARQLQDLKQADNLYIYREYFGRRFDDRNPLFDWGDVEHRATVVVR